jgi:integral membrane sensor domain MASE1
MLGGYKYLPAVTVGAFAANIMTDEPFGVALGISIGNTLEAFLAVYLLRLATRRHLTFNAERDLVAFVVFAAVIPALVAATIGTTSLLAGGLIDTTAYPAVWATWWGGDSLGALLFGLAILVWAQPDARASLRRHPLLAGILLSLNMFVAIIVFTAPAIPVPPTAYVLFPLMILTAFRLHQIGVVTSTVIMAIIALWSTLNGLGPFMVSGPTDFGLLYVQFFIALISLTALVVAVTVSKRERAEKRLLRLTRELRDANDRVTRILGEVLETDGRAHPLDLQNGEKLVK